MKVREMLEMIDQMRPNAYSSREKIDMLNTIEGRVYTDILTKAEAFGGTFEPFMEGQEERELAVPVPFTDLYLFYLASMIDFYNGDAGRYNDTVVLYNKAWDDFAAFYRENNKPKQTNLTGMIPHGWHKGWGR
jgi:hypothetical protein